ncbi:hypothetical protein ZYGR_0U02510 [Zygosaccharomyces rouxii]|uniref:ZYRO0F14388p n=2 Tax=Zygosaccharomyces rouxii TaxID=4956 RepID=C5DYN2_ZYGRC|nr:uncharacterized protein ZYRO0F14388g [Zygosaccharomyces rouxii]KAH9199649.1 auxin efflux carrier [Zygosaccharomyces rouxii]GAV50395.1 hypothetical protein ZYGR_0U02510 [Zygosaccharomyces rouxii]CAR28893.1 ZYRO0F14388p [Zygosaccharomyces rouxii]
MSIDLGAAIYIALKPILKIYTIMGVGFLLARYNIVTMEIARGVSNMVVNAILPCLTFNKIVSNISDEDIKEVGAIALSALILFALGTICALATKYVLKVPRQWSWGLLFAGFFPNISDLPIAYVQSMTNGKVFAPSSVDKGVAYCCIYLMCQSFCMMNFGMWRIVGLDFRQSWDEENFEEDDSNETVMDSKVRSQEEYEMASVNSVEEDQNSTSLPQGPSAWTRRRLPSLQTAHVKEESPSLKVYKTRTVDTELHSGNHLNRHKSRRSSMNDVINEYSAVDQIRDGELDLSRPLTITEELGNKNFAIGRRSTDHQSEKMATTSPTTSTTSAGGSDGNKLQRFLKKYKLSWLAYFLINFIRPASLGASLGIIVSMIPWVKALFGHTNVHVHNAPDGEPVLNFLMDFTSYIGNACVPLGLLLLGGTLARLQVKKLPPGILRVAIAMTVLRLMVIPIVGVAWANKVYDLHWIDTPIGKFVMILTWSMPSATAQVYFTAFYTPIQGSHIQMDCLSVFFMMQYAVLFITVPFVITYTLKKDLNY